MSDEVKFRWETIKLGDKEYVVPSLSIKQAKDLWPEILKLNEGVDVSNLPEKYDKIVKIIHTAMTRNYPELKEEDLFDVVDMSNIKILQLAVMGQSGLITSGSRPVAEKLPVM